MAWLTEFLDSKLDLPEKEVVVAVLWLIRKSRSNRIFRDRAPDPNSIVDAAIAQVENFRRWNPSKAKQRSRKSTSPAQWVSPARNAFKINVNCSWVDSTSLSSTAGILCDPRGLLVDGFAQEIRASSPPQAETLAVRNVL
ncbi:uncharacterized protein J3R85_007132 [Psidium guajava]|nr:uncharacterized protein J3R85_007132 [Psidium guajava]